MSYKNNSNTYQTWVIAYSIDLDSFFCTTKRCFSWEYQKQFISEESATEYFFENYEDFIYIRNRIAEENGMEKTNMVSFRKIEQALKDGKINGFEI